MSASKFMSMDSAPKDGREVILKVAHRAGIPGRFLVGHYMGGGNCIEDHPPIAAGWYFWNGCMFDKAAEPIGWCPLPDEAAESITVLEAWEAIGHDVGINPSKEELLDSLRNMSRLVEILGSATNPAVDMVLTERIRQIQKHGYDCDHDDEHACDEIAALATYYAMPPAARFWSAESTGYGDTLGEAILPEGWTAKPWDGEEASRIRELQKAGALILAELERLLRVEERVAQSTEAVES